MILTVGFGNIRQAITPKHLHNRRPLKVVFAEHFQNVNRAIAFLMWVKGSRRERNWAWINGLWDLLSDLSRNYYSKDSM
jgi:predicted GIY-YIG superfamily endonuclease